LLGLLADTDRHVRASAVSLLRREINRHPEPTSIQELAPLAKDVDRIVRMQVALTLGLVPTPQADRVLEPILKEAAAEPALLEALLAGVVGRETEVLAVRLAQPNWARAEPWRPKVRGACAGVAWGGGGPPGGGSL